AESGTVWMYDQNWYNSGDIVLYQVTSASDETPLSNGTATAGTSTEHSRGDHVHPLNITTSIPSSDTASGSVGTTNYYARNDHSHPINVETNALNISIDNDVSANGTSAFFTLDKNISIHRLRINADGNKLTLNGNGLVDAGTDQTITGIKTFGKLIKVNPTINGTFIEGIRIIAGTGSNNGASDGSVNYSAGNPILWGTNSLGTEDGFYTNGTTVFWRTHALQLDSYYQQQ
ncbi:MAG: hypothetical protein EZS28_038231, partial [Streblomastix strix]